MSGRHYRLPDGSLTRSAKRYVDAWRAFSAPVERVLRLRRYAFDPGLSLARNNSGASVDLPSDVAQFIHRAAVALEAVCAKDPREAVDRLARKLPDPPGTAYRHDEKIEMLARWALGAVARSE